MSKKENLSSAKNNKADEFYTQLSDIEKQLQHFLESFRDKKVICNCDDPELFKVLKGKISFKRFKNKLERIEFYNNFKNKELLDNAASQFWVYFHKQFNFLGLKELIATHYEPNGKSYGMRYVGGDDNNIYDFDLIEFENSDGDFRSKECIELLKDSDIVVTNPPFSLFREYVQQIINFNKKFLIIGNVNAISYKEIFSLIKCNKLWLGYQKGALGSWFGVSDEYDLSRSKRNKILSDGTRLIYISSSLWFTNMDFKKRHEDIILIEKYNKKNYPTYENFNAINVDKTLKIPEDYFGNIGVPITFLTKWNPDQFDILALGVIGSIEFTSHRSMEILTGKSKGKITKNAKGTLYTKWNSHDKKTAAFKDVQNEKLYQSHYARIIIRRKK